MPIHKSSKILILILLIFLILFNYSNIKTEYIPNSPDEAQTRFFIYHFIETGNLNWESEFNNRYNTSIFALRNLADLGDNIYAPKKSLSFIFNMAIFSIFSRIEFFSPLFGLFGIVVFFIVTSKLFNKKIGLVSTILIGISPVYLMYSNFYWENVPALILVFLSYYTFLRFVESKKIAYLILTSIFIEVAIFLRPIEILPITAFFVILLLLYRKSFNFNSIAISGFILFILSSTNLFLNKSVYGGFFSIPEIMRVRSYQENMDYSIVPFDPNIYYLSFLNYVILVEIVFVMAVMGIIYTYLRGNIHQKRFTTAVLVYCLSVFIFYGARGTTYGFDAVNISAVINRYFLPISVISYLFAGVFISVLFSYFKKTTQIKLAISTLILLIMISSLLLNIVNTGGVDDRSSIMQRWSERLEVIRQLPEDSMILSSEGDKYIFPTRNIAIIYIAESPKIIERPDTALIYRILDMDTEIVPLIIKLNNDKINVYITHERNTLPIIYRLEKDDRFKLEKVETWLSKIELR